MRNPRSLSRWLSWWLAVLASLGLGLVCSIVYVGASLNLSNKQTDELRHKRDIVRHLVGEIATRDALPSLRHKLDDFFVGHANLELRLIQGSDALLYATPARSSPGAILRRDEFEISVPWSPTTMLRAELMLDSSADALLLEQLAWTLLASALGGAAAISVGGAWLVRRALLPVRDLARQAAALSPESVGQPLDGSAQAQELQPLVTQFNALLVRLNRAYQQLEGFNADVAHELRTPLATLIGETELALSRQRDVAELRDVLGSNLEDLQLLAGLVNDMLFLSRADRGERARRHRVDSLAELVSEVIEFHEASMQEAGVTARLRGDGMGTVDAGLVRRALSNLLANATRFAERGSVIEVDIKQDTDGRICLSVSNTGPVIPPEHLPRLFDRFYRVDGAREHRDHNHGLGLAIVAAIARMHGGATFVRSAAGTTSVGLTMCGCSQMEVAPHDR